jgi:hypothetical protein
MPVYFITDHERIFRAMAAGAGQSFIRLKYK